MDPVWLVALLSGFAGGMGMLALKRELESLRGLLVIPGIMGLLLPATGFVNYTYTVVVQYGLEGIVSVGYALAGYMLYIVLWSLSAAIGAMVEDLVERVGYLMGYSISQLW